MSDQPHWLTDKQQKIWRDWLSATALITDFLTADLRRHDLDLNEYEVLVTLSESESHSVRMSDLAKSTNQSRSRLTHTVARMERDGYIERCATPEDGRGVAAILTSKGYDKLVDTAPSHVDAVRSVLIDALSDEELEGLGKAMAAVLRAEEQR